MLEIIDSKVPSIVAVRCSDRLTLEDFQCARTVVEDAIKLNEKICLIIEVTDIAFPTLKFFAKDFKFIFKHYKSIEKVAIIGNKAWQKCWFMLMRMTFDLNGRFFKSMQHEQAWEWIKEDLYKI
jgi:hypothetical protein